MPAPGRLPAFRNGPIKALAGALVLAATLAGCALQPPRHRNPQPVIQPQQAHPHSQSSRGTPPCAWTRVRGVAQLMGVHGQHGWYRFYPGNTAVVKPRPPANASPGDEFTAILKKPLNGPCKEPALVLVKPLP